MSNKDGAQTQGCQLPSQDSAPPPLFSISDPKALIPKSLVCIQLTQGICNKHTPTSCQRPPQSLRYWHQPTRMEIPQDTLGPSAQVQTKATLQISNKKGTCKHLASVS